jgi:tRNA(Ile)-lysidine synthase
VTVTATARLIGLIRAMRVTAEETLGVALSGGGDSVALLHLMIKAGITVEAVTIDHGLRPESAAEAAAMAKLCATLGVPHSIRAWADGPGQGNLMDQARRARMGLIRDWAVERHLRCVALGHTRDDQAETLLMGLARSAGIDGLSGMRPQWEEAGIRFIRPLLGAGRQELRDWLRAEGVDWIDDPTNEDDRYARVKARQALAALSPLGITPEGLAEVAGHLASVRAALVAGVAEAASRVIREEAGSLRIDRAAMMALPDEVQRRLIVAALVWVSGADYAPRAESVARVLTAVAAGKDATLWGCRIKAGGGQATVLREAKAVANTACACDQPWDGRWMVTGPVLLGAELRALGAAGLRACPHWRDAGLPRDVLAVTPAVWQGDQLISAPLAGPDHGWKANPLRPFDVFIQSH